MYMNNCDFYDFLLKPTSNEIRKEKIVEKLEHIYTLNVPKNFLYKNYGIDNAINTGLKTWFNQLLALKYYYVLAKKYFKYYKKEDDNIAKDAYNYWCRKNIEIVIILLSSQYDKSLNIINCLFDLRVKRNSRFRANILKKLNEIRQNDLDINNFFDIFSKINSKFTSVVNNIRNNVIHNYSDLYPSFEIKIDNRTGKELWLKNDGISIEEGFDKIVECVNWLEKLMDAINEILIKRYPRKEEIV